MEHIQPLRYRVWGWPAVANFVMGGTAAGFYLLSLLEMSFRKGITFSKPPAVIFTLLSPPLVVLGFLFITFEAGRPLRGFYTLGNLRTSWMSREVLSGTVFVLAASVNYFFPHPSLYLLSLGSVAVYLISQGHIVYRARAITAWNMPLAPILFSTSGLVAGCGLLLIVTALGGAGFSMRMVVAALVCLIVNLLVYFLYTLFPHRNPALSKATSLLRNPVSLFAVAGIGHLLPCIVLFLLLLSTHLNGIVNRHTQDVLFILAGLTAAGGGALQKTLILLAGNSSREIIMGPESRHGG